MLLSIITHIIALNIGIGIGMGLFALFQSND